MNRDGVSSHKDLRSNSKYAYVSMNSENLGDLYTIIAFVFIFMHRD